MARKTPWLLAGALLVTVFATSTREPSCVPVPVEPGACVAFERGAHGVCAMVIGYMFDGEQCVLESGCGCEPDCDHFFDTLAECQEACGIEPPPVLQDGDLCGYDIPGECAEGLACCYPCGIAGCQNVCTPVCWDEPWCAGGCPMYP